MLKFSRKMSLFENHVYAMPVDEIHPINFHTALLCMMNNAWILSSSDLLYMPVIEFQHFFRFAGEALK